MPLNDKQITALATQQNMIQPFHSSKVDGDGILSYGLEPFGYTLTLANAPYTRFANAGSPFYAGIDNQPAITEYPIERMDKRWVVVAPNNFILVTTNEKLSMPSNVQGQFLTKSTLARMGLFANVTWIDAGWVGYLTVEIANLGRNEIRIPCDEGIGQIVFYAGDEPSVSYNGRYQNQEKLAQGAIL